MEAPTTRMAPRSSGPNCGSADQPWRNSSSALAVPGLPRRYLRTCRPGSAGMRVMLRSILTLMDGAC